MTLYINTASYDEVIISLSRGPKKIAQKKFKAGKSQAEKLLPAIDKLLLAKKIKLSELKKIVVANYGGSFTSLRIGVVTANALGYALGIPVEAESGIKIPKKFSGYSIVEPIYNAEPNIGKAKPLVH
ncbi:MAG: tRNA (adenosine(37)-N6)-threonylcarbamoyltransferase complex dimerization subunit type 1 TsaB [Patescibacteria group bacterium]